MTQLPAAMALTNGPTARFQGKFQGAMIRHTPLDSRRTQALVPNMASGVLTGSSRIQRWSSRRAWRASLRAM